MRYRMRLLVLAGAIALWVPISGTIAQRVSTALAQNLQVAKPPGSPVQVLWPFATADEAQISGFVIESSPIPEFTTPTLVSTVLATARTYSFISPSVPTFYRVRSYKDTGTPPVRTYSISPNIVAIAVLLPPPGPISLP